MKLIADFFPLILFFAAFRIFDIYVATAVAMAASIVQVGVGYARKRTVEPTHLITLVVILVFGGMTLLFQDDTFIKWKPTIVNGIFAVVLLGSQLVGRPAIQMLLGSQMELPDGVWRRLNVAWALFFAGTAALNVYVAFYYGQHLAPEVQQEHWVNFKVFGLLALTILFTLGQVPYLAKHLKPEDEAAS